MSSNTLSVAQAVEEYKYATRVNARTKKWYLQKLEVFAEWCAKNDITSVSLIRQATVGKFLDQLSSMPSEKTGRLLASNTLHGYGEVVKTFLFWAAQEEMIVERVPRNIKLAKPSQKIIGVFTKEQFERLYSASKREYNDALKSRDRAILSLLLDTGIRASELCGLTLNNVNLRGTQPFIKVVGKGDKEREIGLGKRAVEDLHRYISRHRKARASTDIVFLNRFNEPINPNGIDQMLYRLEEWSGVEGVRVSAHTFRHTFAVNFLLGGGDIYALARLLGHEKISTTTVYLKAVQNRQVREQGKRSVLDNW